MRKSPKTKFTRTRLGSALLPILFVSTALSLVGGVMMKYTSVQQRQAASMAIAKEGRILKGGVGDAVASAIGSGVVKGFISKLPNGLLADGTINPSGCAAVNPSTCDVFWQLYPAGAAPAGFTLVAGYTTNPNFAGGAHNVTHASVSFPNMCNPQMLQTLNPTGPSEMETLMTTGTAPGSCYQVPVTVTLLEAVPAQRLELRADVGPLAPNLVSLPAIPAGMLRLTIPDLSALPPPTCTLAPKDPTYSSIYWRQGPWVYSLHSAGPADFETPVSAFKASMNFVTGLNCEYTPGPINGTASACDNSVLLEQDPNSNLQANTAAGKDVTIQVPNSVPNTAHNYALRAQVDGPGGSNYCASTIQMMQLPIPTCTLSSPSTFWTPGTTCAAMTFDAPIPASLPPKAPIPPAFLSSGSGTGSVWATTTAGSVTPSGNLTGLSLSDHSRSVNACTATANPPAGTTYSQSFKATATGDAGTTVTPCQGTLTVQAVPPPSCSLSMTKSVNSATLTVNANSPNVPGLNRPLYRPTTITVTSSDGSYTQSFAATSDDYSTAVNIPAPAGHSSTFSVTYSLSVSGPSGTGVCSPASQTATYVTPGCSITANPSNPKMKSDGGYTTQFTVTPTGDTLQSTGDYDPSGTRNTSSAYSYDVTLGSCNSAGLQQRFYCNVSGPAGTGSSYVDLAYQCPDTLGGYSFHDFCYTPALAWGGSPVLTPTKSPAGSGDDVGGFLGCWEAEFAVHAPPDCHWKHCSSIPSGGPMSWGTWASTPPVVVTASNYVTWVDNGFENNWGDVNGAGSPRCVMRSGGSCQPGCFDPETRIRLATGKFKAAGAIRPGDALWNPITQRPLTVKSLVVGPEKKPLVELGYDDKTVKVTQDHPVPTPRGIVQAYQLNADDEVLGTDGVYHPLTRLRKLPVRRGQEVINFIFSDAGDDNAEHMLASEDLVTGDWFVQKQLKAHPRRPLPPLN